MTCRAVVEDASTAPWQKPKCSPLCHFTALSKFHEHGQCAISDQDLVTAAIRCYFLSCYDITDFRAPGAVRLAFAQFEISYYAISLDVAVQATLPLAILSGQMLLVQLYAVSALAWDGILGPSTSLHWMPHLWPGLEEYSCCLWMLSHVLLIYHRGHSNILPFP